MISWIIFATVILLVLLSVVFFIFRKKNHTPDYYSMFTIGIVWLPLGLVFDMPALWALGLIFFAVGIVNKDKWKKPQVNAKDKKKLLILTIIGTVVLLIALALYLLRIL